MSGLYYQTQTLGMVIGSKNAITKALTPATLTATYTDNTKSIHVGGYSKINLDVLYTMGAAETANRVLLKIEGSTDGVNFYRIPNETVSSGTSELFAREFTFLGADATTATISIGLDIFYKYLKISARETGVAANYGTVSIESTLSGK